MQTLQRFYALIQPHKGGWRPVLDQMDTSSLNRVKTKLSQELISIFLGCIGIYSLLFGVGYLLYSEILLAVCFCGVGIVALGYILLLLSKQD